MPSGFLRTASAVRGGVITIDRMAVKRLAVLGSAVLEGALEPAHLEGGVGRAHHAGDLDGHGDAADAGERVVLARVLVQGQRSAVGGVVVGSEPVLPHDHRIDGERAHVLDEARQMKRDLRVARPVVLGRCRDGAHRPVAIDLHHERHGGPAAAEPDQARSTAAAPRRGSRARTAASCAPGRAPCRCADPRPAPPSGRA